MKTAQEPFKFVIVSSLTRIDNQRVSTLNELRAALDQASDASIFFHTFRSLGRKEFSNDFAQWTLAALNRPVLAERLAGLDIREYVSLVALRSGLLRLVGDYCEAHPREAELYAFEPFHFCESVEVTVPLGVEAATLAEFREGLVRLNQPSFYFHFISSRLRLQLSDNDFSHWLAGSLGLEDLARRTNRIDIYTNTLDGVRDEMVYQIDREMNR